jgi:hypothetical protein
MDALKKPRARPFSAAVITHIASAVLRERSMSVRFNWIAAVALTLSAAAASAASFDEMFTVRGYTTLGMAYSDDDSADFVALPKVQPKGVGATDSWSAALDSRAGVQVDVRFTDRLFGVVQLISEGWSNNSWDGDINKRFMPSLEWANLSYRVTDELTVRGGRIVLPILSVAEFRKVGYAQHWIRPPVEVYGNPPYTSSDGIDVNYRVDMGGWYNTTRAHFGYQGLRTAVTKGQGEIWGVNDTVEAGAWTLRGAYMHVKFGAPGPGFAPLLNAFAGLAGTSPAAAAAVATARELREQFDPTLDGQEVDMYAVGFHYDPRRWFSMGEIVRIESDGLVGSSWSGYASAGFRTGAFTPYATYSRVKIDDRTGEAVIPLAGLPPPARGVGGTLNRILGNFTDIDRSQQTLSGGVRWDFHRSFALKAQYDHVMLDDGSLGWLVNQQADFERGSSVNVFSVALEYLF